jgi:hypothetical protein
MAIHARKGPAVSDQTPSTPYESTATASESTPAAIPQQRSDADASGPSYSFAELPTTPVAFEAPASALAEPVTQPVVTEPVVVEPETRPAVTEPVIVEPVTQPVATAPVLVEPVAQPVVAEPAMTESPAPERAVATPVADAPSAAPAVAPVRPAEHETRGAHQAVAAPVETRVGLAAQQRRKRSGLLAGSIIAVIVIALISAVGYLVYQRFYADATRDAVAGHCLADLPSVSIGEDKAVDQARIVACDDPAASYVVQGRVEGLTAEQARDVQVCRPFQGSTFIYRPSRPGYVLCLSKIEE